MRIVSYNILEGGLGRADPIAEVLLAQKADVIGLVEACDEEILDRIAWRLGFDCIIAQGRDEEHASALLSRGSILESINHAALLGDAGPRSFLEATVELDGAALPLAVIHTTAGATEERETQREAEMAEVLRAFEDRRREGVGHLLIGDFNANAPGQRIVPERLKPSSRKAYEEQGDVPRRVVRQILEAGYLDTLDATRPDTAAVAATFTTLHPGQRVDYIFAFGFEPEQLSEAWIETDRLATYASDHYPVGAEVQLGSTTTAADPERGERAEHE